MTRSRPKVGTKAEVAALQEAIGLAELMERPELSHALASLHKKLTADKFSQDTAPARALEAAVVAASDGAITPLNATEAFYESLLWRMRKVGATPEQGSRVGAWLKTQRWATGYTLDRLLHSWPSYLVRSSATAPSEGTWGRREFSEPEDL